MNSRNTESYLQSLLLSCLVTLVSFFCLLPANIAAAENQPEYSSLSGVVKEIYLSERTLVVKPKEEKRRSIVFTDKTVFKGVRHPEEIKIKQRVKVWYVLENDQFKAVKIKVMLNLGC